MSFRKEFKFRFKYSECKLLKYNLYKQGMKELYASRLISSYYFDNENLDMYLDSEEGIVPREKHRVRWCNHNDTKINYEKKISSIEGRFKVSNSISKNNFVELIKSGNFSNSYGYLKPSILIEYNREYFSWQNVRVTFDSNIFYTDLRYVKNFKLPDFEQVVEIKTNRLDIDDYIDKIFPLQKSRFSKYCRGISIIRDKLKSH